MNRSEFDVGLLSIVCEVFAKVLRCHGVSVAPVEVAGGGVVAGHVER